MNALIAGVGRLAVILAWLVVIGIPLTFAVAALGGKFDFWAPLEGFRFVRSWSQLAIQVALGVGVISLILVILARVMAGRAAGLGIAAWAGPVLALLIGAAGAWQGISVQRVASSVPAIHDISTDLENPPGFTAALVERRNQIEGVNPVDLLSKRVPDAAWTAPYSGQLVTEVQAAAYPDIQPILLAAAPEAAYRAALGVAREMAWRIPSKSDETFTFEATAETFWFGFQDDVAVRVTPLDGSGSRVDIRSVSRVGISDLGANAARIRSFEQRLRESVGEVAQQP